MNEALPIQLLRADHPRLLKVLDTAAFPHHPQDTISVYLLRALEELQHRNIMLVGDLVTTKDVDLRRWLTPTEFNAIRKFQVEVLQIPSNSRVIGWQKSSQISV